MSDFAAVFDMIEQFKREHPEIVRAMEIVDKYHRMIEATQPKYETVLSDTTKYKLTPPTLSD